MTKKTAKSLLITSTAAVALLGGPIILLAALEAKIFAATLLAIGSTLTVSLWYMLEGK